jgi:hypothetical protein
MVPRDGIEPPKNLDINGLYTVFLSHFTLIPDKIPDKKIDASAEIRGGGGVTLVTILVVPRQIHHRPI